MWCLLFHYYLLTSTEHSIVALSHEDVRQTDEEDLKHLQQQELEFIQKMLQGSTTAQEQMDPTPPPDQLECSQETFEKEQQNDDVNSQQQEQEDEEQEKEQQEVDKEEVEVDEKQQQPNEENSEVQSQNLSESINAQQTAEENERQSPQQSDSGPTTQSVNVDSQQISPFSSSSIVQGVPQARHAARPSSCPQTVNMQVQMKTMPEKKQQVAVVHGHERNYPRLENPALNRLREHEQQFSMSRQPTLESHLSIDSTSSSHQLSQTSLLWQSDQLQGGTRRQDFDQTATLQQQYEQMKYQLQQQMELQRSQMDREYQQREEQMKQQMLMQWQQYFTQQQHQQQQEWQSRSTQDTNTRSQDDACRTAGFPQAAPGCADASSVTVSAQPRQTEDRQVCRCDKSTVPTTIHSHGPVVVDVISHGRGPDGTDRSRRRQVAYDGGHCRITVGRDSSDTDSSDETAGQDDERVCPVCGLCQHQYETSDDDGKIGR